jgi:hypothetical protein
MEAAVSWGQLSACTNAALCCTRKLHREPLLDELPHKSKHQTELRLVGRSGFVQLRYSASRTEYRFQAHANACGSLIVHTQN